MDGLEGWKGSFGLVLTHNSPKSHQVLPLRDSLTALCFPVFCVAVSSIHLKQLSNLHRTLCPMPKAILSLKKREGSNKKKLVQ